MRLSRTRILIVTLALVVAGLVWVTFMPVPSWFPRFASSVGARSSFRFDPWMALASFLAITALVTALNRRYKKHARLPEPKPRPDFDTALVKQALTLQDEATRSDKPASLPIFLSLLLQPELSRTRTVETLSLTGSVVAHDVNIELSLSDMFLDIAQDESLRSAPRPGDSEDRPSQHAEDRVSTEIYVPILLSPKKEIIDGFVVQDGEGRAVNILCYDETVRLISWTLDFLIRAALRDVKKSGDVREKEIVKAEFLFLTLICGRTSASSETVTETIEDGLGYLEIPLDNDSKYVAWLRGLVEVLSNAFPIVAIIPETPDGRRLHISYRRTTIPAHESRQFRSWLRVVLGLRPVSMRVTLDTAHTSRTYHLQVKAPDSQYLMEQTLRCTECGRKLSTSEIEADGTEECPHVRTSGESAPYFQLLRKRGQHYAHVYMRGFAGVKRRSLQYTFSFGEVPPGTLASAAITAATSSLLIGAVRWAQASGVDSGSDVPALILALPAVAASWFGFTSDSEAILRSSLAARCSLILGGCTSLTAAAFFILSGHADGSNGSTGLMGNGVQFWWSALLYLAVGNLIYVLVQLTIRSASYRRLLRKEPVANDNSVAG